MASPPNNNSSSSPPIPNRPNPKPRNSEVGDPLRRSFKGNPFPINSRVNIPSDISRRNSVDFSDKENETKSVLTTPKGSNNFMSPTISAVSKINASPRKKVLSDKNQMSQSSDVKGQILEETKSQSCNIGINEKKQFEGSHDMTITDFDENEGFAYSDPRFRISPRPSVPYTSPEVGPLLPPYDPKKNYLSPRPPFLHYRPNPRIEPDFDECKQLDDLFISESSSSDTELSANCVELEEEVVEETKDEVKQLEAESDEEMVCESIVETSQVPKQSGFKKLKFLGGWLLALATAYLLVSSTFSPRTDLLKELPLYEFHIPRELAEFAKANNLKQLSEKIWSLTESSLVHMSKLISRLGGKEEYGPFQFHNLTDILEDYTVFQPTRVEIDEEPLQDKSRSENNLEDGYVSEFEEETEGEDNSEVVCETKDCDAEPSEVDEQTEMKQGTDIELNEGEGNSEALLEDGIERKIEEQRASEVNPVEENNDARGSSESQVKLETGSTEKDQVKLEKANQHIVESAAIDVHKQKESEVADAETGAEEMAEETIDDLNPKVRSLNKTMVVSSSTLLVLLAAVAYLFAKKAKPVAASAHEPIPKIQELNMSHVPVKNLMKEKLSVDSSFNSNNNYPKEHQTGGGKKSNKKVSMASSASEYSVVSFSYGSFTTYEKIPIKSGDKEEEMITPVRRSSRLRNHHQPSGL